MNVKITSYNCCSIRKRIDPVREILLNNDIVLLQEIILLQEDCGLLQHLDEEFDVYYVPSKAPDNFGDGRPIGGLATLCRKSINWKVQVVQSCPSFLMVSLEIGTYKICIVNVYMPCDDRTYESLVKYQSALGELQGFLDETDCQNVLLFGDFNTSYYSDGRFWPDLNSFILYNALNMNDLSLPNDTFTYMNTGHGTTSWIDHVLSSANLDVANIVVHYEAALYDHFPMSINVRMPVSAAVSAINVASINDYKEYVDWKQFKNERVVRNYNENIAELIGNYNLCLYIGCPQNHEYELDSYYRTLVDVLKQSTEFSVKKSTKRFQPVAGWNDHCRHLYQNARECFLEWVSIGKPRVGGLYDEMNESRKLFKKAMKFCKYNEEQIKIQKLAGSVLKNKPKIFWREVARRTGKASTSLSECIDGLRKPQEIADHFAAKFKAVNGHRDSIYYDPPELPELPGNSFYDLFTPSHIKTSMHNLKQGIGCDGIHANHFKFLNDNNKIIILNFFNSCFIHNYFPPVMMEGVIQPRPKNKFGDLKDSTNYREVMQSSYFLKILEYLLLPFVKEHCKVSRTQYGYRSQTSTLLAVSTFKEVVNNYINNGSVIYACFLDMSKAFERINHSLLVGKLHETSLPKFVVFAIEKILSNSYAKVHCHGAHSNSWKIEKGSRQGGILSAHLFSIYIDQILETLLKENYGCYLGINKINVQAYADDLVIFGPTSSGLRKLLSLFESLANTHELTVNVNKTKIMLFHKKRDPHNDVSFNIVGQKIEVVSSYKYLGVMLSYNLKEKDDIKRLQSSFNRKVGMTLRKFHATNIDVKMRLFKTLCSDMYGIELWGDTSGCSMVLKQLAVSYHYALKRIIGLSKRDSNHYACYLLDELTFEHMCNYRMLKFYQWLSVCQSPCIITNKHYFMNNSSIKHRIDSIFYSKYNIENVMYNDIKALVSRMKYVQFREPSSWQQ